MAAYAVEGYDVASYEVAAYEATVYRAAAYEAAAHEVAAYEVAAYEETGYEAATYEEQRTRWQSCFSRHAVWRSTVPACLPLLIYRSSICPVYLKDHRTAACFAHLS